MEKPTEYKFMLNLDDIPVSPHSFGCLLFPGPAMYCQHRAASPFQHPCICQRPFLVREHPDLTSHRHFETLQSQTVSWQMYRTLSPNSLSRKCRWPHTVKQTLTVHETHKSRSNTDPINADRSHSSQSMTDLLNTISKIRLIFCKPQRAYMLRAATLSGMFADSGEAVHVCPLLSALARYDQACT